MLDAKVTAGGEFGVAAGPPLAKGYLQVKEKTSFAKLARKSPALRIATRQRRLNSVLIQTLFARAWSGPASAASERRKRPF